VTADQLAVDEKVIRVNGDDYWLYGAVDPETTKYCSSSRFKRRRNRRHDGF
jgi:transposase-like protein